MSPVQLNVHMLKTYRTLRWCIAALGLLLPWLLWLGGRALWGDPLQSSMSAYYHTPMRDVFVGVLFAVSGLLFAYKGYTPREDWSLNLAGLFLAGVALFPTAAPSAQTGSFFSVHGTLAVLFFVAIAVVCVSCSSSTLGLLHDPPLERRYRTVYRGLGILMVLSPAIAAVLAWALQPGARGRSTVFFAEATGVYVFSAYWVVKSVELGRKHRAQAAATEKLAAMGKLRLDDAWRVTEDAPAPPAAA